MAIFLFRACLNFAFFIQTQICVSTPIVLSFEGDTLVETQYFASQRGKWDKKDRKKNEKINNKIYYRI